MTTFTSAFPSAFASVVHSEWTKFRTVRGWVIATVAAAVVGLLLCYATANGSHSGTCTGPSPTDMTCSNGHPFVPSGPGGEAVADSYYFVSQPLAGNGTLTARVTSLTGMVSTNPSNEAPSVDNVAPGLAAWAKAGILVTPSTTQGSTYAAVMATGDHGVRWQYDYTHDHPGLATATSPVWLRVTRTGATITGYDSTDGTTCIAVGSTHVAGPSSTVAVGLFVTSPVSFTNSSGGVPTIATATFDHVSVDGGAALWRGQNIGSGQEMYPSLGPASYSRSGDSFVVTGSGDIAPGIVDSLSANTVSSGLLVGIIVALIVMIVVATMFITSEYRRGLIRTTFTATPRRRRVLAAKAIVIGATTFVTTLVFVGIAVPLAGHLLRANGNFVFPASTFTDLRIIAGAAALAAVIAVSVVAIAAIVRRSAAAIAAGIVVVVVPYAIGAALSGSAERWLFRVTPAAGFAVLAALPRAAQVSFPYTMSNGYYPLAPWAGLAVVCVYTAVALGVASRIAARRDA